LTCTRCEADQPATALKIGPDGENVRCMDEEACRARVQGVQETPGTLTWLIRQVSALTSRVETLEAADRLAGRGPARPYPVECRCKRPGAAPIHLRSPACRGDAAVQAPEHSGPTGVRTSLAGRPGQWVDDGFSTGPPLRSAAERDWDDAQ
jgi:hypothetical protein